MEGQMLLFFILTLLIGHSSAEHCDRASTRVREGNLGQSADFQWLGVLNVHLPEWDKLRIAMTGIVLIKIKYALANADDVVRLPQNIFKSNGKAMFLAARNTPWYVKLASYVAHPEYEYSTLNSIAVVELNLDEVDYFPLTPICLPNADTFHTSRYLYLTGFTDDNLILEKVIYKIKYLDIKVCEEFYNRTMTSSKQLTPSAYLCGYVPNSVAQCVWENGMVLVSNATGYQDLIGFGIHGPGCAAPARFIDLFPYFSWIESVTGPYEVFDAAGYRRKEKKSIPTIPIHELYTMEGSRRFLGLKQQHWYPFETEPLKHYFVEPSMDDHNVFMIKRFKDTMEEGNSCSDELLSQVYTEHFVLKSQAGILGTAEYKLSLYDFAYSECRCVRLTCVNCTKRSKTILAFKESLQYNLFKNVETPDELFRYYPMHIVKEKRLTTAGPFDPQLMHPHVLTEDPHVYYEGRMVNYDLYIKFHFTEHATLKFEMLARTANNNRKTDHRRRAKSRVKERPINRWGMLDRADKLLKEAEMNLVADVVEVLETESAARSDGPPGAVVLVCWLVSACLTFFIY